MTVKKLWKKLHFCWTLFLEKKPNIFVYFLSLKIYDFHICAYALHFKGIFGTFIFIRAPKRVRLLLRKVTAPFEFSLDVGGLSHSLIIFVCGT